MFNVSYLRMGEAFRDFGLSVAYYCCMLFGIESGISPTVNDYSGVLQFPTSPPENMEEFTSSAGSYFSLLFNGDNFSAYWDKVGDVLFNVAQGLTLAFPAIVLLIIVVIQIYKKANTKHNKDTLPLRAFKWVAERTYQRYEEAEREPGASVLAALADFYGVSADYLLGRTDRRI